SSPSARWWSRPSSTHSITTAITLSLPTTSSAPKVNALACWLPMSDLTTSPSSRFYVREHHPENGTLLGFWIYLMSDCLIFACLFATYAVLGRNYAGGPTGAEIFELPTVALNTA